MEAHAERELEAAGIARRDVVFTRYLNICYPGQTFDMAVPAVLTKKGRMTAEGLAATVKGFHDLHEELHAYAVRDEEPVIRAVRVHTIGRTEKVGLGEYPRMTTSVESALRSRRPAWFGGRFEDTPVYDGDKIGHGHRIEGPAVVEERFTTLLIPPGQVAEVDWNGNYVVSLP